MRKLLLLMLLIPSLARAQRGVSIPTPDCEFGFSYTVTAGVITSTTSLSAQRLPLSQGGGGVVGWDNRSTGCTSWTMWYQADGVSALSIEPDSAASVAGVPGAWGTWTPISVNVTLPLTSTSQGQVSFFQHRAWVSVNLNSASGTGNVTGRVIGWRTPPGGDSNTGTSQVQLASGGITVITTSSADGQPAAVYLPSVVGGGASAPLGVSPFAFNGTTWDKVRTCTTFKTATATASGNTALWTPASGKKFRLMRLYVTVSATNTIAAVTNEIITFQDGATAMSIRFDASVGTTAAAGEDFSSGWVDLGNGILSAAANNVLNLNLGTAVATGPGVTATVCGTEE